MDNFIWLDSKIQSLYCSSCVRACPVLQAGKLSSTDASHTIGSAGSQDPSARPVYTTA